MLTSKKAPITPLNLIFGTRAVMESILAGRTIEKIFLQRKFHTSFLKELYDLIHTHEIPFSYVPIQKLQRLANGNHQGVVAVLSPIAFVSLDRIVQTTFEKGKAPLILLLDGVTDVHNVGAIVRTACCMGVDALVLPTQGSASLSGAAMKTSAGALARLPLCRVANVSNALGYLQSSGLAIVACHEQANQALYQVDLKMPMVLILGGEGTGIATEHLKWAMHHIKIPMHGTIASLNVSVAAGMVLYEVLRQRFV
ncbi:23S rRNA (guanosine(2251)-2'-O)-methyltransferase RlmB [Candidatus Cardinium hertigii]|uniref:23S rRNA (Guanosine(2251)-2'-O)-methyltransferase RlmB n=1 Tax=Candidatus Cardinium hertigii TaxID=247481 RepID=A0A3N2QCQ6_9BACT|nr:23S rRNA (guanosine(2251)-2'-O)-methyltransferase RlmB [Candidatus Cardinium hertigii]ROT47561.1 23S rRNA (guanosine(2251)-2'-O)-methyltransferase RlmB [Candidatus Cardinium hertigii]